MTTEDLMELRELAEAATPGNWTHIQRGISRWHGERIEVDLVPLCDFAMLQDCCVHEYGNAYENAAFVAAANPAKVIELLDALEALGREVAELKDRLDADRAILAARTESMNRFMAERDQARAELAAIRAQKPVAWLYTDAQSGDQTADTDASAYQKEVATGYMYKESLIRLSAALPKIGGV